MKLRYGLAVACALVMGASISFGQGSGKEVYEKTCKECHGSSGEGNTSADKFYQMRLPRLNSDYVQKKSDAELKEIMTKGKRKMGPPKVGQMFRHPSPEEMDAVIAYLRTFKKSQ